MRSEGFYVNEKFKMTPAGIEPTTFRFVAQHINHCATVVTRVKVKKSRYRPEVAQRVPGVPRLHDNDTG